MLIAITGKAGAGKSTAAEALVKSLGFVELAFADPLKQSVMHKFGLSEGDVYSQEGKKTVHPVWGITPGEILQREGTEVTRAYWGDDFWLRRWRMNYDAHLGYGMKDVIVPDCRFDNEAEFIRSMGGKIVRIVRPDSGPLEGRDPNHPSERGISDKLVDTVIINDGTLEQLRSRTKGLVNTWGSNG